MIANMQASVAFTVAFAFIYANALSTPYRFETFISPSDTTKCIIAVVGEVLVLNIKLIHCSTPNQIVANSQNLIKTCTK